VTYLPIREQLQLSVRYTNIHTTMHQKTKEKVPWMNVSNVLNPVTGFAIMLTGFSLVHRLKTGSLSLTLLTPLQAISLRASNTRLSFKSFASADNRWYERCFLFPFHNITNWQPHASPFGCIF